MKFMWIMTTIILTATSSCVAALRPPFLQTFVNRHYASTSRQLIQGLSYHTRTFTRHQHFHLGKALAIKGGGNGSDSESTATASVTSTYDATTVVPPVARREEDRVIYAGVAPPGWDPDIPRQAEDSPNPLLDPPVAVPDPYGTRIFM